MHQYPYVMHEYSIHVYLFTFSYRSVGSDAGTGYNVNIAWEGSGAGDIEYLEAMRRIIIPLANQYKPEVNHFRRFEPYILFLILSY